MMLAGGWLARRAWLNYLLGNSETDLAFASYRPDQDSLTKPCSFYKENLAILALYDATTVTYQINYFPLEGCLLLGRTTLRLPCSMVHGIHNPDLLVVHQMGRRNAPIQPYFADRPSALSPALQPSRC